MSAENSQRFTMIQGKLIKVDIMGNGSRVLPSEIFENFHGIRKNTHDKHVSQIISARKD